MISKRSNTTRSSEQPGRGDASTAAIVTLLFGILAAPVVRPAVTQLRNVSCDVKSQLPLLGVDLPDQALPFAAGILWEQAFGGRPSKATAKGLKPLRQRSQPGSLNPGKTLESDGRVKPINTRKHRH